MAIRMMPKNFFIICSHVGGDDTRHRSRHCCSSRGRRHRLPRGRARVDLLRREDPARLPRATRLQHRHLSCRQASSLPDTPVFLQGSVVEWGQAEWAIGEAVCDGVEMTRAQIADPDMVTKLRSGAAETVRPCIRCNQTCQVRDVRNPIVSCVGEPSSGRETEDPDWYAPTTLPAAPWSSAAASAGLKQPAPGRYGYHIALVECDQRVGGIVATAGPGAALAEWLESECRRLGVEISTSSTSIPDGDVTIQCTGSQLARREYEVGDPSMVIDVATCDETRHCRRTDRIVRSDRWSDRRGPCRGARRAGDPDHAGSHRGQRAVANRRPGTGQRSPRAVRGHHRALFRAWLLNSDELLERVWGRMDRYHLAWLNVGRDSAPSGSDLDEAGTARFIAEVASAKLAVLRTMRTAVAQRGWKVSDDDEEDR